MFVRKSPNGNDFNVYLAESYRDINGQTRQRIIRKLGLLSEINKNNPNAFNELKEKYKKLSLSKNKEIRVSLNSGIAKAKFSVNYGYFFIEPIYEKLGIDKIITQYSNKKSFQYDLNSILKMLVISRILYPKSKKNTIENQNKFFEKFNNKLADTYRALSNLNEIKDEIQLTMHKNVEKNIGRDLTLVLYDLTNYYFETEVETELKKKGVSKEHKTTPIVQMGLLIDKNKIPIGYELFPGNTHDSKTAIPMINKLKNRFGVKRTILTADKGINSQKNFAYLVKQGDGYIVSQKIRGSKKEFINEVLDEQGYTQITKDFKIKEIPQTRNVKLETGEEVELKEKVVIFWSRNFDVREKHKRVKLWKTIKKFIDNPATLNASNSFGVKKYIKTKHIDKKTGKIKKINPLNTFDEKKYNRDQDLDGYYAIVTSEINKPALEILATYHELWKIEESFKVIKSDLEGRPVYVSTKDHIEGHFLTCFVALTILRILEMKLNNKYSAHKIRGSLTKATCKEFTNGYYSFEPQDNVIRLLQRISQSFIANDVLKTEEIKKYKKTINQHIF